ncbi:hypothetical protein JG687_00015527 [Phytophthora cactorum]|uniref:Kinesin motor domain-containing protein n=1 Tax=Phytophthora cactorum TaxID=29920 RepID=A0A8T1TT51_9STRA|nr:hypothetical protein JG687_00015527 [Phytophthora cactorum]
MHLKQRDGVDFHFNDVFDPSVSQEQVFNEVCLDIVYSALDGYNGTILAYGQTGSGKTYTITGGEHYADRGIIPRVLSTIFEEFEKRPNMHYSCYISYLEIYNENIYDLLDRSHTDRPIEEWTKVLLMDDDEGDMHFRNLGVFEAVSEEEALNLLFLGNMNRVTSDTPMNQVAVDIVVNTEVDTEKRLETVEKLNAELETTNLELQQRAVQLENDIKDQALHFAKQEQQWGQRLTLAQEETQAALAASKSARDRYDQKIDWMQCEEIVERLLLTGDLPREELDKPSSEGEFDEARLLYEAVAEEIKELGMATALRSSDRTFDISTMASPDVIVSLGAAQGIGGEKRFLRDHNNKIRGGEKEDEERNIFEASRLNALSREAKELSYTELKGTGVKRFFKTLAINYNPVNVPIPNEYTKLRQLYNGWYYYRYIPKQQALGLLP